MSDNATEMTTNVSDDGGDPHSNLTDRLAKRNCDIHD